MERNILIRSSQGIFRVISELDDTIFVVDCFKKKMPFYLSKTELIDMEYVSEDVLPALRDISDLTPKEYETAQKRYTIIADILSVINDDIKRTGMIEQNAALFNISKQSIRSYLYSYLVHMNLIALAPSYPKSENKPLSDDEKNMRWSLNKFYYTRNRNSLMTAYTMMLKEKYCDPSGNLKSQYPTYYQFKYFYRKTLKMENYYISRDGLSNYQRNNRPLLGDGVQSYAPSIGTAMLDGTVCDIYLVNDACQIVGRPILVVACDANTSLCMGYSLQWEGGTYSLVQLMQNIICDKVKLCKKIGINITREQWNVNQLPAVMITDGGSEYKGQTFEQISELGVTLVNLPPYRAELKGTVEKLFDLIQSSYKDVLKGKGVIMPDFHQRGSHDYRKDSCITIDDFERIIVKCIVFYNSKRIIENYPYTQKMLAANIKPYASDVWNWKMREESTKLISVSADKLILTLLPRTNGVFTRFGLKVNKLRYHAEGYKEQYLQGGECIIAYDPDNCSKVWLKERNGNFIEFNLIESRFKDMKLSDVRTLQRQQKQLVQDEAEESLKAKIELMDFIESIAEQSKNTKKTNTKLNGIRSVRTSARKNRHKDMGGIIDG